ncbi:MAG: 1-(5-phosphoribosyl)-5-[(5-phosphoribosylamino)methylideneamino]imidazole-4-carboxamide isomerase [Calditrichaceae bacterium]|nr:1-(5-phosphoribosyl)-5-[(5-phosphoribosylamino)methylideneamino]imidazole-4-carboxamide isomerase [Calditrichaceae bacterium]MBN2708868.1 1-(5-phosphoribosyl)-5-[(5-phosphoribosylamino)methylideneamino]imidazole-4-carboxamide isomerase [Calditrichaceae bacterium]RQV97606.1 MAG: 1-(5-phosphoribosyl)-5-[(5-phosphoribosylamino)methylideneamino]imidazole-4-carboxamide isomerase [Calditrichota bacterium]
MITIIPAIDVIDGKCVRLTRGDYATKKIYSDDPLETARLFEDHGIKRLHMVDLDGAREKKVININTLKKVADGTNLVIDFGGGVQTRKDLELALDCGAQMITAGSIAVRDSATVLNWLNEFGAETIILGADYKRNKIAVSGWQESADISLTDFIKFYYEKGIRKIICTDIQRDGMLAGPALQKYIDIKTSFPEIVLIASGGVSGIDDVKKLNDAGIDGVIIGKAIYENRITLKELEPYLC